MSLMERVRELGADEARVEESTVAGARRLLMGEIARARPAHRRRRTARWAGVGIGGLVAGTAVSAIVVGSVLAPAEAPSASAAEVLNAAAETTLTASVLDPAPGQYIRIQEVSTQMLGWRPDPSAREGGHLDSTTQATNLTLRVSRSLYVPADRTGEWFENFAESKEVLEASGPHARAAKAAATQPDRLGVQVYEGGFYTETGVGAEGVEPDDVLRSARNGLSCYYDEMPRDPGGLVKWLENFSYEYPSECPPPRLGEPVDFNLAPADLRATMFKALALVDGAYVAGTDGNITTIAFPDGGESNWMQTVDVDTSQGLIVGRGNVEDDRWSTRVVVTIADEIPALVPLP